MARGGMNLIKNALSYMAHHRDCSAAPQQGVDTSIFPCTCGKDEAQKNLMEAIAANLDMRKAEALDRIATALETIGKNFEVGT